MSSWFNWDTAVKSLDFAKEDAAQVENLYRQVFGNLPTQYSSACGLSAEEDNLLLSEATKSGKIEIQVPSKETESYTYSYEFYSNGLMVEVCTDGEGGTENTLYLR